MPRGHTSSKPPDIRGLVPALRPIETIRLLTTIRLLREGWRGGGIEQGPAVAVCERLWHVMCGSSAPLRGQHPAQLDGACNGTLWNAEMKCCKNVKDPLTNKQVEVVIPGKHVLIQVLPIGKDTKRLVDIFVGDQTTWDQIGRPKAG